MHQLFIVLFIELNYYLLYTRNSLDNADVSVPSQTPPHWWWLNYMYTTDPPLEDTTLIGMSSTNIYSSGPWYITLPLVAMYN